MFVIDAPGAKVGIVLGYLCDVGMEMDFFVGKIVFPFADQVICVVIEVNCFVVVKKGGDIVAVQVGPGCGGV